MRSHITVIAAGISVLFLLMGPRNPGISQEIDERPAYRVHLHMERYSFDDDDPVKLHICVKNSRFRHEYFKVYDREYVTFQPVVYNSQGREAEILVPHRLKGAKKEEILKNQDPRVISLARNETMTHTVDLRNMYRLDAPGEYRVRVYFVPDPERDFSLPSENTLRFKISRRDIYAKNWLQGPIREKGPRQGSFSISPREVVTLFLTAEKERNWDNYLKYLRLESFINSYPNFGKLYNGSDDVEKLKVEDDFIKFLKSERGDYIIDFSVDRENLVEGKDIAYVDSRVKRYGSRYHFRYSYRYTLEKFEKLWLITGVEASVKKGY
ncbi:MAG: hypothetical protein KBA61_10145 [Spirochaetes bacterium]|nr:hypothetical protein [Spirochaetota bacterium]